MVFITIVTGAYKQTYNWGASHCINVNLLQWLNKTYVSPRFTRHRCWSNTFQAQTPALRPNVPQRRSKAWLGRPGKRRWNGVDQEKSWIYQGKLWIYNIYNPIYTWIYSWCIVVCICTSWFMIHWRVACFYWSEIGFIVGYSPFMIRRKWNKQEWFPRTWKLHQ